MKHAGASLQIVAVKEVVDGVESEMSRIDVAISVRAPSSRGVECALRFGTIVGFGLTPEKLRRLAGYGNSVTMGVLFQEVGQETWLGRWSKLYYLLIRLQMRRKEVFGQSGEEP